MPGIESNMTVPKISYFEGPIVPNWLFTFFINSLTSDKILKSIITVCISILSKMRSFVWEVESIDMKWPYMGYPIAFSRCYKISRSTWYILSPFIGIGRIRRAVSIMIIPEQPWVPSTGFNKLSPQTTWRNLLAYYMHLSLGFYIIRVYYIKTITH